MADFTVENINIFLPIFRKARPSFCQRIPYNDEVVVCNSYTLKKGIYSRL